MSARRHPTAARIAAAARPRPARPAAAPTAAAAAPAALEAPLAMQIRPLVVRCEYLLSTYGHRFLGLVRSEEVIDTGYHRSVEAAAAAYGTALAEVAAARAARYTG